MATYSVNWAEGLPRETSMRRNRQHATKAAAVSTAVTLMLGAAVLGITTGGQAVAAADDPKFTIGMTNEVDSFNPFNGIEAESYEAWALMYDYMISWSEKDLSPAAEPRHLVGDDR